MKGSSAQNLIDWRISRCCKLITAALMSVLVLAGSFVLPAAASSTVDTSDWVEVDVTPYVLFCNNAEESSSYVQLFEDEGIYYFDLFNYDYQRVLCYSTKFDKLFKDCTYKLTFTVKYHNLGYGDGRTLSITNSLPSSIVGLDYNSFNVDYTDLINLSYKYTIINDPIVDMPSGYNNKCFYEYTIVFSTAEGGIDNFGTGVKFLNLEFWYEKLYSEIYDMYYPRSMWIEITDIDASCIVDPSAEYYFELTKDRQNKLVDLTKESVGKMKESLEQVTIIDDMSSAVDYVSGAIGNAAALISPAATFAGDTVNIYPAFALFSNIYNNVMGSVDPALLALAATVPLLCFLAWLFSSLFKSIL